MNQLYKSFFLFLVVLHDKIDKMPSRKRKEKKHEKPQEIVFCN